ncbi:MAG: hypothetical protein ACLFVO_10970, partial [Chloroflexaceae bacterium]
MHLTWGTLDAASVYAATQRRAWLDRIWTGLRGRPQHLLDLKQVVVSHPVGSRRFVGYQTVPIEQIRGSEERSHEFDAAFRPLRHTNGKRWRSVACALLSGVALPPVELIRVGADYFVRDGHHRVSVARALGRLELDASVTVWELDAPPPRTRPALSGLTLQRSFAGGIPAGTAAYCRERPIRLKPGL